MTISGGLLPYRRSNGLEVLIAHPGGPFWANRHEGAWSVVKGELAPDEDPWAGACREFTEETGWPIDGHTDMIDLGETRQKSGKRIRCWGFEADYDPEALVPGTFQLEIRGRSMTVPEIDRVRWCEPGEAGRLLNPAQVVFVERLGAAIDAPG